MKTSSKVAILSWFGYAWQSLLDKLDELLRKLCARTLRWKQDPDVVLSRGNHLFHLKRASGLQGNRHHQAVGYEVGDDRRHERGRESR